MLEFETGFAENLVYQSLGAKQCPTCMTYIIKEDDLQTKRVACIWCLKKKLILIFAGFVWENGREKAMIAAIKIAAG